MTTLERRRNWKLSIYGREHGSPHVHVNGPEFRAVIEIASGAVLAGALPAAVLLEARQWLKAHQADVMAQWQRHNPDL